MRKQYEDAGMSIEVIQAMYEYDWSVFNAARSYQNHTQEIAAPSFEQGEESYSSLMNKYQEVIPETTWHQEGGNMQALGVDIQTIQSIVGHADTEMTEHYLHVQESIRQSAIQLFSEAFSAWKLDGTALIRPDKIFGIVVKIVVKTKWGQLINKKIQRFLTWNRWIFGPAELDKSELFPSTPSAVKVSSNRTVWAPSL